MNFVVSDQAVQQLIERRNYTQAEHLLKSRLAESSGLATADPLYFLGVVKYFQGDVGTTIDYLKKALEVNSKHTDAAICLSVLMNDIGRYDEAKKVFEQANQSVVNRTSGQGSGIENLKEEEINKKFAVKHLELADLYLRYRRYDEAIEEYGKAIWLDSKNLDIRIRRAKALAKKGFLTRAMQELQQLKSENTGFIPARIQLGLLHYSQGNVLDADLEWESVLDIDPKNREAHAYLEMSKNGKPSSL